MSPHDDPTSTPADRRQREAELHAALVKGRMDVSYDVTRTFHLPLLRRLQAEFSSLRHDPELEGCLFQALAGYFLNPNAYQPEKGSLYGYLYQAAKRDALNLIHRRNRHPEEPLALEIVAEGSGTRKEEVEREVLGEVDGLPEGVELRDLEARLRAGVSPEDHPVIPLMLAIRVPLESYVQALGLQRLPPEEQARRVKLAKDRVHAARRRLKERYRHDR